MTRIFERLPPSWASHWSSFRRPSTKSGSPFFLYLDRISAVLPKHEQSTNVVSSFLVPSWPVQVRLTARPKSQTAGWLGRYLSSGSRVRLPMSSTLLRLAITHSLKVSRRNHEGRRQNHVIAARALGGGALDLVDGCFFGHFFDGGGCGSAIAGATIAAVSTI